MKYKLLGNSGIHVSELCFGTMTFGDAADEAESAAIYTACRDAGINFFDCANVYVKGRSEEILGELVQGHRDEVVLTSKFFFPIKLVMRIFQTSKRSKISTTFIPVRRMVLKTDWIITNNVVHHNFLITSVFPPYLSMPKTILF